MIEVRGLVKRFGNKVAVDSVSFSAERGQIVGVLGPNGAGKTTTLRMICGYLRPTAGTAIVAGVDVAADSLGARQKLAYLPESVPLYPEMRVAEYLQFRAGIKRVPAAKRRAAIARALEQAGIADRRHQTIGTLSKGYRQRVGLADVLVARPPLLVLDEPTAGLDPNQVLQVRALIRELRGDHTVLLSSHILSEVELTCDQVVIFHHGRVVAQGSPELLQQDAQLSPRLTLELLAPAAFDLTTLSEGVGRMESQQALADGWIRLEISTESDQREVIHQRIVQSGLRLRELTQRSHSLEEVFHRLTSVQAASPVEVDQEGKP
jgi:ABC-2 type transport system ATP-binding protein